MAKPVSFPNVTEQKKPGRKPTRPMAPEEKREAALIRLPAFYLRAASTLGSMHGDGPDRGRARRARRLLRAVSGDHCPGAQGDGPGGCLMSRQESRRAAELKALRAELERRLDRLDFRFHYIGPALAEMARHAERTIRRLAQEPDA